MFANCTVLEQINIPRELKTIGSNAFNGCTLLTISVALPENFKTLGAGAFANSGITGVTIPKGVSAIPESAFQNCTKLSVLTLTKGLGSIESSAFSGCSSLTTLEIPDGVTVLKESCFSNCGLQKVKLPDTLSVLGDSAFNQCAKLSKVRMPKAMKEIGENAFCYCALTTIIVPDGITRINERTFMQSSYYGPTGQAQKVYLPKSLIHVSIYGFFDALNPTNGEIYYAGSETQWTSLDIYPHNDCITNCKYIHYNASRSDAESYDLF